jgi:hypothetical protein
MIIVKRMHSWIKACIYNAHNGLRSKTSQTKEQVGETLTTLSRIKVRIITRIRIISRLKTRLKITHLVGRKTKLKITSLTVTRALIHLRLDKIVHLISNLKISKTRNIMDLNRKLLVHLPILLLQAAAKASNRGLLSNLKAQHSLQIHSRQTQTGLHFNQRIRIELVEICLHRPVQLLICLLKTRNVPICLPRRVRKAINNTDLTASSSRLNSECKSIKMKSTLKCLPCRAILMACGE